jgi:hypothetical protein
MKKKPAPEEEAKAEGKKVYYEFHDFESVGGIGVDSTRGLSGKSCARINDKVEYGLGLAKLIGQLPSYNSIGEVNISFNCWMDKKTPDDIFVFSVEDTTAKKSIYWEGKRIEPVATGSWSQVKLNFKMNKEFLNPQYVLKLYPWNKGKNTYYYDDLAISFEQAKQ